MTQQPNGGYGQPQPAAVPRPGDLLDRFLARLIDYVVLWVVNLVIVSVVIVGAVMGHSMSSGMGGFGMGRGTAYAANAVSAVVSALITLGYFALLESARGQTIGKMLLKLQTTGPDGQPPSLEQAARRNIWTALGVLGAVPLLGWIGSILTLVAVVLIAIGINSDTVNRQAWHDHFAGETRVWKIG